MLVLNTNYVTTLSEHEMLNLYKIKQDVGMYIRAKFQHHWTDSMKVCPSMCFFHRNGLGVVNSVVIHDMRYIFTTYPLHIPMSNAKLETYSAGSLNLYR